MKEENNGGISRRGFMKRAALAGAALVIPSGLSEVFASEKKTTKTSGIKSLTNFCFRRSNK